MELQTMEGMLTEKTEKRSAKGIAYYIIKLKTGAREQTMSVWPPATKGFATLALHTPIVVQYEQSFNDGKTYHNVKDFEVLDDDPASGRDFSERPEPEVLFRPAPAQSMQPTKDALIVREVALKAACEAAKGYASPDTDAILGIATEFEHWLQRPL